MIVFKKCFTSRNLLLAPFCDEIKHDGKRSLATTHCTAQRDSLALCNLVRLFCLPERIK